MAAVLIAADFSNRARQVARWGADLAGRLRARIVLLHADTLPAGLGERAQIRPLPHLPEIEVGAFVRSALRDELERLATELRSRGAEVEIRVELGDVTQSILRVAESVDPVLILVASPDPATEDALRRAGKPVLTVSAEATRDRLVA